MATEKGPLLFLKWAIIWQNFYLSSSLLGSRKKFKWGFGFFANGHSRGDFTLVNPTFFIRTNEN